MIKKYISLNSLQLTTTIKVKETEQTIVFRGGIARPTRINGSLITDNPQLQVAIESDSGYGKSFISDDFEINQNIEEQSKSPKQKINKLTMIESINSAQMAIEWIRKNLSIELKQTIPSRDIRKFAASQGYDFPNLTI